jgi:hypothetical protein
MRVQPQERVPPQELAASTALASRMLTVAT